MPDPHGPWPMTLSQSENELRAKIKALADGLVDGTVYDEAPGVASMLRLILLGQYDPRK